MSCVTNENDFSWDSDCQSLLCGTCFLLRGYVTSASWLPLAAVVHIVLGRKYERLYLRVEISRERMGDLRCGGGFIAFGDSGSALPLPYRIRFCAHCLKWGYPAEASPEMGLAQISGLASGYEKFEKFDAARPRPRRLYKGVQKCSFQVARMSIFAEMAGQEGCGNLPLLAALYLRKFHQPPYFA